jgi:lipopolysaccharide/colanic/teichoic acid biosynthesis glycosyltransferase
MVKVSGCRYTEIYYQNSIRRFTALLGCWLLPFDNFEDVLRLDIRYIENWSLWLDLRIVLKTVQVILCKSGAY